MADRRVYVRPKPNEWVRPVMDGFREECCDCCLVHEVDFRVVDEDGNEVEGVRVEFRKRREECATRNKRRTKFPGVYPLKPAS